MKVLFDCTYLRNKHTGVEEYFFGLIYEILKIDTVSIYTILVDTRYDTEHLVSLLSDFANYRIQKIYSPLPLQVLYSALFMPIYLAFMKFDIYHNPYMFGPIHRLAGLKTKIVITVHDLYHKSIPHLTSWHLKIIFTIFSDAAIKRADRIIAISKQTKYDLEEYLDVRRNKVHVIYQALRSKKLSLSANTNISVYDFYDKRFILTVGWVLPSKGLDDLIEGFVLSIRKYNLPDIYLISAGSDKHLFAQALRQNIRDSGYKNIRLLGYVKSEDLDELYRRAYCVVAPSHYEGFGLTVLEAMAFGKPVIIRNTPTLVEVAGNAALQFSNVEELADAIYKVLTSDSCYSAQVNLGKLNLRRFSGPTRAKQTIDLYKQCIKTL